MAATRTRSSTPSCAYWKSRVGCLRSRSVRPTCWAPSCSAVITWWRPRPSAAPANSRRALATATSAPTACSAACAGGPSPCRAGRLSPNTTPTITSAISGPQTRTPASAARGRRSPSNIAGAGWAPRSRATATISAPTPTSASRSARRSSSPRSTSRPRSNRRTPPRVSAPRSGRKTAAMAPRWCRPWSSRTSATCASSSTARRSSWRSPTTAFPTSAGRSAAPPVPRWPSHRPAPSRSTSRTRAWNSRSRPTNSSTCRA